MSIRSVTPILNVSNVRASQDWLAALGWQRGFSLPEGEEPTFGSVGAGSAEIFLCLGAQGSRGTVAPREPGDDRTDGVWMSWWLGSPAEVDELHTRALALGYEVSMSPQDEPWGVREMHLRHPDGHTFRVSAPTVQPECDQAPDVPLPALLRHARRAYGRPMRAALAAAGFDDPPPGGMFVVGALAFAEAPPPIASIARALGMSREDAVATVAALARAGLLSRVPDATEPTFALTERGREAARIQADARVAVGAALAQEIGEEGVSALRRGLAALCALAGE